jgi:hypothetical protein
MKTYTITFADGTKLENLTLNPGANTFHSASEITAEMFDGKLSEVHIFASDGDMSQCAYPDTLHNAELVQIMQPTDTPDGTWQFILREIPEDEAAKAKFPLAAIARRSDSSTPFVIHPIKTPMLWMT